MKLLTCRCVRVEDMGLVDDNYLGSTCVHCDGAQAVATAKEVGDALRAAGRRLAAAGGCWRCRSWLAAEGSRWPLQGTSGNCEPISAATTAGCRLPGAECSGAVEPGDSVASTLVADPSGLSNSATHCAPWRCAEA